MCYENYILYVCQHFEAIPLREWCQTMRQRNPASVQNPHIPPNWQCDIKFDGEVRHESRFMCGSCHMDWMDSCRRQWDQFWEDMVRKHIDRGYAANDVEEIIYPRKATCQQQFVFQLEYMQTQTEQGAMDMYQEFPTWMNDLLSNSERNVEQIFNPPR